MEAVLRPAGDRAGEPLRVPAPVPAVPLNGQADIAKLRGGLQRGMTVNAGVVRDEDTLQRAAAVIERATPDSEPLTPEDWEHRNLLGVGGAVVAAARARLETRGAHTRTDYPDVSARFQRRILVVAE